MKMLDRMLVLTATKHTGQFDKGGKPYILHCLKVMHYVRSDDEELLCIALGHDLMEDTDVDSQDLYNMGFTDRIVYALCLLNKNNSLNYDEYKKGILSCKDAMLVKRADLRHNSDIRRLKGVSAKDIARIAKYQKFYLEIDAKLKKHG